MSKGKETKFKEKAMADLRKLPYSWVLKTQQRSQKGIPDLILCLKGHLVAIELKAEGGEATKLQMNTLRDITEANGIAFVACPSTWEFYLGELKRLMGV